MNRLAFTIILLLSFAKSVLAQTPSQNCTKVGPGVGTLVGPDGATWSISATNDTLRNGFTFSNGKATVLEVAAGRIYVFGTDTRWYGLSADGSVWIGLVDQTDPCALTTPPPVVGTAADCTPPLGRLAPSIFVTDWSATTGRPGSRARVNFQLASPNSPIVTVVLRLAPDTDPTVTTSTTDVSGANLTVLAGLWFVTPSSNGTYRLTVYVKNAAGCELTTGATRLITVTGGVAPPPPPPDTALTVTVQ